MTTLPPDQRLAVLTDHHKETFAHVRDYIRDRNRLFVYALVAVVALGFRAADAAESNRVLQLLAQRLAGEKIQLDAGFVTAFLWFVLFAIVLRYFQAALHVNRQYEHLAAIEDEIEKIVGGGVLSREGKGYAERYKQFSTWSWRVYAWGFPLSLLGAACSNVILDARNVDSVSISLVVSGLFALATIGITVLYLFAMKEKAPEKAQSRLIAL
ncbi:MAG: hypothetical protein JWP01_3968 [Myxococcales bacterium]|nr:hypothetical protein [Myxococcales bacterium]